MCKSKSDQMSAWRVELGTESHLIFMGYWQGLAARRGKSKLTTLQEKAMHPKIFVQHNLVLIGGKFDLLNQSLVNGKSRVDLGKVVGVNMVKYFIKFLKN